MYPLHGNDRGQGNETGLVGATLVRVGPAAGTICRSTGRTEKISLEAPRVDRHSRVSRGRTALILLDDVPKIDASDPPALAPRRVLLFALEQRNLLTDDPPKLLVLGRGRQQFGRRLAVLVRDRRVGA